MLCLESILESILLYLESILLSLESILLYLESILLYLESILLYLHDGRPMCISYFGDDHVQNDNFSVLGGIGQLAQILRRIT